MKLEAETTTPRVVSLHRRYHERICVSGPVPRLFKFHVSGRWSSKQAIQKKICNASSDRMHAHALLPSFFTTSISDRQVTVARMEKRCTACELRLNIVRTTLVFYKREPTAVIWGVYHRICFGTAAVPDLY